MYSVNGCICVKRGCGDPCAASRSIGRQYNCRGNINFARRDGFGAQCNNRAQWCQCQIRHPDNIKCNRAQCDSGAHNGKPWCGNNNDRNNINSGAQCNGYRPCSCNTKGYWHWNQGCRRFFRKYSAHWLPYGFYYLSAH